MAMVAPSTPKPVTPAWQRWVRENLFSSPWNTALTILTVLLVIFVLRGTLTWAFTAARWDVIPANWTNLMVGPYPREHIWRVWAGLIAIMLSSGFSWGTASRGQVLNPWRFAPVVVVAAFFAITQAGFPSGLLVPLASVAVIVGFFAGRAVPVSSRFLAGLWAAVFFGFVALIGLNFGQGGVQSDLWGGLMLTALLALVAIVASFPLGVLLAIGRTSKLPIISGLCVVFIEVVRGVPLVVVLFIAQLFVPLLLGGWNLDKVLRAMIGMTIFSAAYLAENVRGGLQSVHGGQSEAARALGLSGSQTLGLIVLPQALRAVLPALVGQFIALFKDTSLVAIIGLKDLLGVGQSIFANPDWIGRQMELYLTIAVIYAVFSYAMSGSSRTLEKRLNTTR